jgi:hypothetical protein
MMCYYLNVQFQCQRVKLHIFLFTNRQTWKWNQHWSMIWGNVVPLFWDLYQLYGITYLIYEWAHITLVVFGSRNLENSRTARGLPVAERGLLPLKGQELTQPDVTFKHSCYSEILAARYFFLGSSSLYGPEGYVLTQRGSGVPKGGLEGIQILLPPPRNSEILTNSNRIANWAENA